MADVKMCDRCEKIYTTMPAAKTKLPIFYMGSTRSMVINTISVYSEGFGSPTVDLCQECIDSFCKWLNKEKEYAEE